MAMLYVHELGNRADAEVPVLAVHGITAHGRRFRRLAEEAWPSRRTVAVDLRGHGRSLYDGPWSIQQHVADLVDTLDGLKVEQVDYVGHSYGGAIGLALLQRAPERIRRIALLDPALAVPGDQASENALAAIGFGGWASPQEAEIARGDGLGPGAESAVAEEIAEHLIQAGDGSFRFRFHLPAVVTGWGEVCYPLPASLPAKPALLIVADRAQLVSPETEAKLLSLLPDLTVSHLQSGHMHYWERFHETADSITSFWAGTAGR